MNAVTIPDWADKARQPEQIEKAAKYLQELDAPQAIESLARLSRRAPGWIVIELSLIVRLIACLIGFGMSFGLIAIGIWIVYNAISVFLHTFFPDWQTAWWIVWAGLVGLWVWHDATLRSLLSDQRFRPSSDSMTHVWVIVFKPFYALAAALRLCAALIFLTLRLALAVMTIVAIAHAWQVFQAGSFRDPDRLMTFGFAAVALYLAFGLFIFSDWPRTRQFRRQETRRQQLIGLVIVVLLAATLGLLVREWSRDNRDWIGLSTGVIMLVILTWFLRARSATDPFEVKWVKALFSPRPQLALAERQVKFLKWTLLLLGLMGLGFMTVTFAQNWTAIRLRIPQLWLTAARDLYGYSNSPRADNYWLVEPWLFGFTVASAIGLLGTIYSIGWAVSLSKPFAWPFFWLYSTAHTFLERVRARLAVRDAIRHHRARNMRLSGVQGRQAVCREHLARFESRSVRLAYWRRWTYWWCRVCKSDAQAYTGVRTVRGVLNQNMTEREVQQGQVLMVNLLLRLDSQSAPMPLDLDEVEIGHVDDQHDIEMFVAHYQNFGAPVKTPTLKQIKLKINADSNLNDNIERMLKHTIGG
jgi:hypothetical protein